MDKASLMYTAIQGLDFKHIQYGTAQSTLMIIQTNKPVSHLSDGQAGRANSKIPFQFVK
jgi:hypothetical protein